MSEMLPQFDADDDGPDGPPSTDNSDGTDGPGDSDDESSRGVWLLLIALAFAVAVAGLAFVLLLRSPDGKPNANQAGPTEPNQTTSAVPSDIATSSYSTVLPTFPTVPKTHASTPTKSASTSNSATPPTLPPTATHTLPTPTPHSSSTNNPCGGPSPCFVDGDGGAKDAMQARTGVPGSLSAQAQECALREIEDVNCGGVAHSYITERTQDGPEAVADLFPQGSSLGWFTDKNTSSFEVGWAYNPATQLYYCVFLKN